jgi:hypothetical protein
MSNRRRAEPGGPKQNLDGLIDQIHGIVTGN